MAFLSMNVKKKDTGGTPVPPVIGLPSPPPKPPPPPTLGPPHPHESPTRPAPDTTHHAAQTTPPPHQPHRSPQVRADPCCPYAVAARARSQAAPADKSPGTNHPEASQRIPELSASPLQGQSPDPIVQAQKRAPEPPLPETPQSHALQSPPPPRLSQAAPKSHHPNQQTPPQAAAPAAGPPSTSQRHEAQPKSDWASIQSLLSSPGGESLIPRPFPFNLPSPAPYTTHPRSKSSPSLRWQ